MELYHQSENITVSGILVKDFPEKIKEAFDSLFNNLGAERDYFGISWMDENGKVVYYAMAREAFAGEGRLYGYELFTIEKGSYKTEMIRNWMSKTGSIKDVLHNLMGNNSPGAGNPCIEWYRSDEEMLCMVKADIDGN